MLQGDAVVGYVRVSTADQGDNGYGLEAQRAAIEAEAQRRGWRLVRIFEDVASGASTGRRTGLNAAIKACTSGQANGIVAAKVDRISRSVADFADLLQRARRGGWNVVACDLGVDLSSPMGEAMASMAAVFAQLERRFISERTKAGLAVARTRGVKLGRPRTLSDALVERIRRDRDQGATWAAIANRLDGDGVQTAQGGRWWPATVRDAVLRRA